MLNLRNLKSKTSSRIIRQVCRGEFSDASRLSTVLLYDGTFARLQRALLSRKLLSSASIPQDEAARLNDMAVLSVNGRSVERNYFWNLRMTRKGAKAPF